jgi:cytoskeletal protein CcmA (bactofilin family)
VFRDLFGASKANTKTTANQGAESVPATPRQCSETVLGIDTHFEGQLNCKGNVRVDGTFIGGIETEGRITLGDQATVEGDLIGECVTVSGIVRGNIVARRITVQRTGRIWGDLVLEQLSTEEGAFIQGVITMEEALDIPTEIQYAHEQKSVAGAEAVEEAAEEIKKPVRLSIEPVPVKVPTKTTRKR